MSSSPPPAAPPSPSPRSRATPKRHASEAEHTFPTAKQRITRSSKRTSDDIPRTRRRWTSYIPLACVIAVSLAIPTTWSLVRLAPELRPRITASRLAPQVQPTNDSEYVLAVWLFVFMLVWSLVQTCRGESANYVTRADQYIASSARLHRLADAAMRTEEEILYDLPDLFEYLPGFVCEVTCDSDDDDDPSDLTRADIGPAPLASWSDTRVTATAAAHVTPHILMPTLTHKVNGCRRWCRRCQLYKPDRAHHCHVCGRCVKMSDHHCGVIGVCIGFHNYKHFMLFLLYIVVSCSLIVFDCCSFALVDLLYTRRSAQTALFLIVVGVACASLAIAVAMFLLFHLRIRLLGFTSLEWLELPSKRAKYLGITPVTYANPYRIGAAQQMKHIFGFRIWQWLLPVDIYAGEKFRSSASDRPGSVLGAIGSPVADSTNTILSTCGRILDADGVDGVSSLGVDADLDELSAVPLLSSRTLAGSPIPPRSQQSIEATRELAAWERTHGVAQRDSQFERSTPHPIHDAPTAGLYARAARIASAAEGVLGRAEESLVAEWQARGIAFPTGPNVVHPQLEMWRQSRLFKQA